LNFKRIAIILYAGDIAFGVICWASAEINNLFNQSYLNYRYVIKRKIIWYLRAFDLGQAPRYQSNTASWKVL